MRNRFLWRLVWRSPHFEYRLYWTHYVRAEETRSRYAAAFSCASYIGLLLTKCSKGNYQRDDETSNSILKSPLVDVTFREQGAYFMTS
jgi:hypothetical protein